MNSFGPHPLPAQDLFLSTGMTPGGTMETVCGARAIPHGIHFNPIFYIFKYLPPEYKITYFHRNILRTIRFGLAF